MLLLALHYSVKLFSWNIELSQPVHQIFVIRPRELLVTKLLRMHLLQQLLLHFNVQPGIHLGSFNVRMP